MFGHKPKYETNENSDGATLLVKSFKGMCLYQMSTHGGARGKVEIIKKTLNLMSVQNFLAMIPDGFKQPNLVSR